MAVRVGGRPHHVPIDNYTEQHEPHFICDPAEKTAAVLLISLGALGIGANVALMGVIFFSKPLRRWVRTSVVCYVCRERAPCSYRVGGRFWDSVFVWAVIGGN